MTNPLPIPCRPPLALRAGVLSLLLGTLVTAGWARGSVEVEGETFSDAHNVGGMLIQIAACAGASGGYVADGLDVATEWIELQVNLPFTRCFADSMAFQGNLGQTNTVTMSVFDFSTEELILTSDFVFAGAGVG